MNEIEIWKDIPGYDGFYQASSLGRIKSLARTTFKKNGMKLTIQERIRQQNIHPFGYFQVNLSKNGVAKNIRTHILIAYTFLGPRPSSDHDICHNDGNSLNNAVSNLRYDTKSANQADKILHGTANRGQSSNWAKLSDEDVIKIFSLLDDPHLTQKEIATLMNVTQQAISRIKRGRCWSHLMEHQSTK